MSILYRRQTIAIFIILSLGLLRGSISYPKSEGNVADNTAIDSINFGELVSGDAFSKEDLRNYAVGIEFWRIKYPPCSCGCGGRKPLSNPIEWHAKYESKGLILLAFHIAGDETKEEIIALCKSNKIDFPIYKGGRIKGIQISDIPTFILFDHRGDMVYNGDPKQAGPVLDKTMASAPDPLVGEGTYKKLKALAQKIKVREELGKTLSVLQAKYLNSADADEKAEAGELAARLARYGNRLVKKARRKKDAEPLEAFNLYREVAALFKGNEIGDAAEKTVKELKTDKDFQDNIKAEKEYDDIAAEVTKLKQCGKCGAFNHKCAACKKMNPSFDMVRQKSKALAEKYPNSSAANKLKELLPLE
ncbi:MAG: hypothetical protein V1701_00595 [Planctomycetota bacterium]